MVLELSVVVLQCVLFLIALGIVATQGAQLLSLFLNVPLVSTSRTSYGRIESALSIRPGDVVYELGSGNGHMLDELSRKYPEARFVGIERNPLLYLYAKLNARMHGNPKNLSFRRADFYRTDFSEATRIYAYLLPLTMERLYPRFAERSAPLRFVSLAFQFKQLPPTERIELQKRSGSHGEHMLYIYEF
jgi:hypothetical protein